VDSDSKSVTMTGPLQLTSCSDGQSLLSQQPRPIRVSGFSVRRRVSGVGATAGAGAGGTRRRPDGPGPLETELHKLVAARLDRSFHSRSRFLAEHY
jgi:hypothetical protein